VRRRARDRSQGGFTLIEMMMVLALAGAIALLAVPSLIGMVRRWNLATTMRTLYGAVLETQSRARATGVNHRLVLDKKQLTATILKMDTSVGTQASLITLDASHSFGFRPDGFPDAFPKPYDTIPRSAWCTFCGFSATSGYIELDSQGLIARSSSGDTRGSIALYDPSGRTDTVEALLFVGRTGDIRLFRHK
jgi:prepilin-type N-terminal cleavage/methylation domain-containing protein